MSNGGALQELKKISIGKNLKIRPLYVSAARNVTTKFMGEYPSVFKGTGIEFADYRQYSPSDDASKIDWLHSLKANKLLVREYVEERNLTIMFLVNTSNSMLLGSQEKLKHEYAAELVSSMAMGALTASDAVGLCMASNRIREFIAPSLGLKQCKNMMRALVDARNYGGHGLYGAQLGKVSAMMTRNSLIFLVSDFINNDKGWKKNLAVAARKHQVIAIIVRDPIDNELPASGHIMLQDPFSGEQMLVDTKKIRKRYNEEAKRDLDEVKATFTRHGVTFIELATDKDFAAPIWGMLRRRKKSWS